VKKSAYEVFWKAGLKKYEISAMLVNWKVFGGWWSGQKSAQKNKITVT